MKYTKEQLQAMSFDEALDALGEITGSYISINNVYEDVMSLAFEHGIGLTQPMLTHQSKWQASWFADGRNYGVADHYISDENPLRAIACCLILVLQGEKE